MSDKERLFVVLEERGEAAVRALLETNQWGTRKPLVIEWLTLKELERAGRAENREAALLDVAKVSAAAATRSATAAQDSKTWAAVATIAAIVTALATVAIIIVPL